MKLQFSTWPQVQRYFEAHDTVLIPVGSIENHGRHLPLGTDALVPEKITEMVERQTEVLSTPVIAFGNCPYFEQFPGTINLGHQLLFALVMAVADALFRAGARRFVFINGHGGNSAAIEEVCYSLSKKGAISALMNWWTMAGDFDPAWAGGHGGAQETSAILYINPNLVDKTAYAEKDLAAVSDRIRPVSLKIAEFDNVKVLIPRDVGDVSRNGWYGEDELAQASPEWGEKMLKTLSHFIANFVVEFKKAPLGRQVP